MKIKKNSIFLVLIIIGIIGLILYWFYQNIKIPKKQQQTNNPNNPNNPDYKFHHIVYIKPTGKDVTNLPVCHWTIKNGDYAYVSNQEDTGISGIFVIVDASYMQANAMTGKECNATVSQFIASHYGWNGWLWSVPDANYDFDLLSNGAPHYVTET